MHATLHPARTAATLLCGALSLLSLLALAGCPASDDDEASLPQLAPASPGSLTSCESLATNVTSPGLVIASAARITAGTLTVAGQNVGAHCLVSAKLGERVSSVDGQTYAIRFEMRLPQDWNGRFLYQANGGLDGNVSTAVGGFGGGPLNHALRQGFAVISSDAGHTTAQNPSFGVDPQARLDFGYQAVAKLTPLAKELIRAAYGRGPDRSYFAGCSNGGRHAFVAASRYADQYDGILAGAPGWQLPKAAVANIFGAQRYASVASNAADISTGFTAVERKLVADAVLGKCDALDGAVDGLVQDSVACQTRFNLATDVPTCAAARDGSCLSAAQKTAVAAIFKGAVTSSGAAIYAGFPFDSGHGAPGVAFWEFTAPVALDSGAVGFVFGSPPQATAGFNGPSFALTGSVDAMLASISATSGIYTESGLSFMTPPNPSRLDTLRGRGGKILVYHGLSDAIFSADDTRAWLANVKASHGDADGFARFFPVPGMGHCSGGPATDQADFLTPLVAWVEQGQAPDRINASARGTGNVGGANADLPATWSATRTRPLCPAPKVARYKGAGSIEDGANFDCKD
jgi:pimeloyl-ACP methyl ester carboxylesterase